MLAKKKLVLEQHEGDFWLNYCFEFCLQQL